MFTEEMIFWLEEECNTSSYCENFIENILEYMLDNYILELDMEELYNKSLEKLEIVDDFTSSNTYYTFKYEYTI